MNFFEIVALNPNKGTFNVIETGYASYKEALIERDYWANQYPQIWIEVITKNERIAMIATDNLKKANLV